MGQVISNFDLSIPFFETHLAAINEVFSMMMVKSFWNCAINFSAVVQCLTRIIAKIFFSQKYNELQSVLLPSVLWSSYYCQICDWDIILLS